ncbi:hypothetical protein LCGC14_0414800 [marine sediment metagenome]|uniref:Uncharacterized protein n=1 Tax=marine sediment metagenome TaxID=412755 RepID=A0A0F9SSU3_9ZZZZ
MGERQENVVDTKFTSNWEGASRGLGMMGRAAQSLGGSLMGLTRMFGPLTAAMSAITSGALVRQITMINSRFEQTSQVIGGTLAALGFAGGEDPTERFRNGLGLAEQTMRQIQISAAALPGEAEDYITVFRAALPNVSQSMEGNLADMTSFTNRITAIGRSFGIDAQQIGRDTMQMLRTGRGGAGMDVRTWMQLLPFINAVAGQADVTADSFNRMTQPERLQVLTNTFESLDPMLADASNTFDSMFGAIQSTGEELMRIAGRPIFEGVKEGLGEVNALLMDENGEWTELGQRVVTVGTNISAFVVDAIRNAVSWMQDLSDLFGDLADSPLFQQLDRMVTSLLGAGRAMSSAVMEGGPGGAAGIAGGAAAVAAGSAAGLGGPAGVALVALGLGVGNFLTRIDDVAHVMDLFGNIIDTVSTVSRPLVNFLTVFSDLMGDMIAGILPGLLSGLDGMLTPVIVFAGWLLEIGTELMEFVQPALHELWEQIGVLLEPLGWLAGFALVGFGLAILAILVVMSPFIVGMLALGAIVIGLGRAFTAMSNFIARNFGGDPAKAPGMRAEAAQEQGFLAGLLERIQQSTDSANDQTAAVEQATGGAGRAGRAPGARGGANTQQDFRYSRFTIEQSFAEGFDPDRIAVAFADDVGRLGEQRLESGFAPLFGIR